MKQSRRRSDTPELPPKGTTDRQFAFRFIGVIAVLHIIIGTLVLIGRTTQRENSDLHSEQERSAIAKRLAPPGQVATDVAMLEAAAPVASAGAAGPKSGEATVQQVCSACHQAGVLGAPRIGDKAAWSAREKSAGGVKGLVQSASHGKGNMPPRGGRPDLTDEDLRAAIETMLKNSGGA